MTTTISSTAATAQTVRVGEMPGMAGMPETFTQMTAWHDADLVYVMCRTCICRTALLTGMHLGNTRCRCGGRFEPLETPATLRDRAPQFPGALHDVWTKGCEAGYWGEPVDQWYEAEAGSNGYKRAVWLAYSSGHLEGRHLREIALGNARIA